ncbi:Cytochrome c oxidase subunit 6A1, mitochondrial [Habropoda laboriosa]|uniref:Cytochrome c oxidase subunit 6A1, mitochondrial n=1 Tax=Habropoda laboriosa TaxID=597456 RepID=A0A0L7QZ21_9HYME|nr:PREDICTED: cytochrome c oxidase subunit 6A1, mitochondrial-like [Habropoda laboriosa]KOC63859.1 Cytochrome c oxidase subunit 6A1, mitochondrial [Habropoda laboriosa]
MAHIPKLGQCGHTFTRGFNSIVKTVEQRTHKGAEKGATLWRNISIFVGLPLIILSNVNSYLNSQQHHRERPEFIAYPYLKIINKPFPWGDGKHSLFHNPKVNYVPGIGYEE